MNSLNPRFKTDQSYSERTHLFSSVLGLGSGEVEAVLRYLAVQLGPVTELAQLEEDGSCHKHYDIPFRNKGENNPLDLNFGCPTVITIPPAPRNNKNLFTRNSSLDKASDLAARS